MTDDLSDGHSSENNNLPSSRKVARTMLESDSPDLNKIRQLLNAEESAPRKRIAKTLIDVAHDFAMHSAGSGDESNDEERKIAKTKLDLKKPGVAKTQLDVAAPHNSQSEPFKSMDVREVSSSRSMKFVAKTKLDLAMLSETILKYEERKEARAVEEAAERARHPRAVVEPVVAKRVVKSCPYTWDKANERIANCANCNSPIYNFDGLDMKRAEALIFKRENKSTFTLFKRADGKLMTQDCPVHARNRNARIVFTIFGVIAVILLSVVFAFIRTYQMSASEVSSGSSGDSNPSAGSTASAGSEPLGTAIETSGSASQIDAKKFEDHYANGKRERPTFNADDESKYWD